MGGRLRRFLSFKKENNSFDSDLRKQGEMVHALEVVHEPLHSSLTVQTSH